MKRSRGSRSKARSKLTKDVRDRGMPPVTHSLREFEEGEKVSVVINPSIQDGQPHPRFHGLTGTVAGKQGRAFVVDVRDGGKAKSLIVRPEHLKRA